MAKSKYGNKKVSRQIGKDIYEFDSKKEATRFDQLVTLLKAKKITDLKVQPEFELSKAIRHNGKTFRSVKYISDFQYTQDGKTIVEDVKGFKTDVYMVKVKWFLSVYGNDLVFKEI